MRNPQSRLSRPSASRTHHAGSRKMSTSLRTEHPAQGWSVFERCSFVACSIGGLHLARGLQAVALFVSECADEVRCVWRLEGNVPWLMRGKVFCNKLYLCHSLAPSLFLAEWRALIAKGRARASTTPCALRPQREAGHASLVASLTLCASPLENCAFDSENFGDSRMPEITSMASCAIIMFL